MIQKNILNKFHMYKLLYIDIHLDAKAIIQQ